MRVLKRAALVLVVLVVLDVLVGVAFLRDGDFRGRPAPPYDLTFSAAQARMLDPDAEPSAYTRFDPDLGWSLKPHGARELRRANAAGFRAQREYSLEPPDGVVRVAAFGDSFTHGGDVSNEATWTHLLESAGRAREVLNFGVSGYGTDQAFLRYRRDGARYRPHVVLIGFLMENLLRNVSVYRPAYFHRTHWAAVKPRFTLGADGSLVLVPSPARSRKQLADLVRSRRLLETLERTDFWVQRAPLAYDRSPLFWSSVARIAYSAHENSGRELEPYYRDPDSEPFRVTAAILREFHKEARSDGAQRAVVLLFPTREILRSRLGGQRAFWQSLAQFLEREEIPFVDLTPPLLEAARRVGLDALFERWHYNKAGNAVVAGELERALFSER